MRVSAGSPSPRRSRFGIGLVLAVCILAGLPAAIDGLHAQEKAAVRELETVTLDTGSSYVAVAVEIADTPELRAKGLMHRDRLAPGRGMLLVWERPGPVAMWMRNTKIPLDMVFILETGHVHRIVEGAEPYSEEHITSDGDVLAVLEVNAGTVARVGLRPGDRVHHPTFGNTN